MNTIEINGKQVTFELKSVGGSLYLEATHIDGKRVHSGNILSINGEGFYNRCWSINEAFGLTLNKDGKIKQAK